MDGRNFYFAQKLLIGVSSPFRSYGAEGMIAPVNLSKHVIHGIA